MSVRVNIPLLSMAILLLAVRLGYASVPPVQDDDSLLNIKRKAFTFDEFSIGRDFVHNTFKDRARGLRMLKECNFTIADAAAPQDMELCEQLGLSVVVSSSPHLVTADWMRMSDRQIDAYVRKLVEEGGKDKAIAGYHITDEPSAEAFDKLAVAIKALKKYAPGKPGLVNLYPNYSTLWTLNDPSSTWGAKDYDTYLRKAVDKIKPQILSYDNYMVEYSDDMQQNEWAEKYFTNLVDMRRLAKDHSLPFWNIVTANQIRPFTTIPSLANMSLQAYTSLAAGASGLVWFTYTELGYRYAPIDASERRTLSWRYLQEVNRQMLMLGPMIKRLRSTGVYFYGVQSEQLPKLPGDYLKSVQSNVPLMIGEFVSDKGNRYLMVVNLSLAKSGFISLATDSEHDRFWEIAVGDQTPYFNPIRDNIQRSHAPDAKTWSAEQLDRARRTGFWLTAGAGMLIKVSK